MSIFLFGIYKGCYPISKYPLKSREEDLCTNFIQIRLDMRMFREPNESKHKELILSTCWEVKERS